MSNDPEIRDQARYPASVRRLTWTGYLTWLYWAGAAGLVPWIVYLFFSQAKRAQAHQVHILAAGLIVAMALGLLATAWLCARDSPLSVMAASFAATATLISAWFRILTQTGGSEWAGSIPTFLTLVTAIVVLCVIAIRAEVSARSETALSRAGSGARWLPLALAIAGLALHRRPATAVVPATVTGTLLLCDAWINIIPSAATTRSEGIALAFVEVPIAAVSFWVGTRAISQR